MTIENILEILCPTQFIRIKVIGGVGKVNQIYVKDFKNSDLYEQFKNYKVSKIFSQIDAALFIEVKENVDYK